MTESAIATQIEELESKALADVQVAEDLEALDEWRVSYLGRRGELTQILRGLGSLPAGRQAGGGSGGECGASEARRGAVRQRGRYQAGGGGVRSGGLD